MNNLRGAALMVLAMLGFALEDMLIKMMAERLSIAQMLAMLGLGGSMVFALVLRLQGQPLVHAAMLNRAVALRAVGEIIGTIGFVSAIVLIPLSTASAILQATPLVVTLGAALFLGENVGWRRWSAILVGFAGVLIIIRPGLEGFNWLSLFAVQGVLGLALRDLSTRQSPPALSSMQLSFLGFLALVPTALLLQILAPASLIAPDLQILLWLIVTLVIAVLAYYCIVAAMRVGDVGFVSPFRYTRMVFALIIGVFVFAERPDFPTLIGAAIIIGSGVYMVWREQKLQRQQLRTRST